MKFSRLIFLYIQTLDIIITETFKYELENYVTNTLSTNNEKLPFCIGKGCSANVYSIEYQGTSYAVKKFTDRTFWKRETEFLIHIERYKFEMIPTVYLISEKNKFIISQKIDETLKSWLNREYEKLNNQESDEPPNTFALRNVLVDIFNGLFLFHEKGLVHGDIHMPNIMINQNENKVYLIDFGNSLILGDPTIDILRLKYKILNDLQTHGFDWLKLLNDTSNETDNQKQLINVAAFKVIDKIYKGRRIRILFWGADYFLAPNVQSWICWSFKFFTNLDSLIDEYKKAIRNQENIEESKTQLN
ncbi:hypothetical protein GINT2_001003 [Glugoides intestinalis]